MNNFGLTLQQKEVLQSLLARYFELGTVVVYGSRAKGTSRPQSDIDLVICSTDNIDRHLLAQLQDEIDESDFPYLCDIQYLDEIKNLQLRDHIDRIGQVFY